MPKQTQLIVATIAASTIVLGLTLLTDWSLRTRQTLYITVNLGVGLVEALASLLIIVVITCVLVRKMEVMERRRLLLLLAQNIKHNVLQRYGQRVLNSAENLTDLHVKAKDPLIEDAFSQSVTSIKANMLELQGAVETITRWQALQQTKRLDREAVDLQLTLQQIVTETVRNYPPCPTRTLTVVLTRVPIMIFANRDLIYAALTNLVENAFKYSQHKGSEQEIHVLCQWNKIHAIVTITDNGYGIPREQQNRLGELFFRANNIPAHISGTGVGLTTTLSIIRAHGGLFECNSVVDTETTVSVRLPLAHRSTSRR